MPGRCTTQNLKLNLSLTTRAHVCCTYSRQKISKKYERSEKMKFGSTSTTYNNSTTQLSTLNSLFCIVCEVRQFPNILTPFKITDLTLTPSQLQRILTDNNRDSNYGNNNVTTDVIRNSEWGLILCDRPVYYTLEVKRNRNNLPA